MLRRVIPLRVFLSQTSPQIPTRTEKMIVAELKRSEVPMLHQHLNHRTAFQSAFTFKLALDELDEGRVNGLAAARRNADEFAAEGRIGTCQYQRGRRGLIQLSKTGPLTATGS